MHNVRDIIIVFIIYSCAYVCLILIFQYIHTDLVQRFRQCSVHSVMQGASHLDETYRTCPAGLLGVPQSGRGTEDQEVQESEGVPLNSTCVLHLVAWNIPAKKDKGLLLVLRFGTILFHVTVFCATSITY